MERTVYTAETHDQLLTLAVQIVSAHIGNNDTPSKVLPGLIKDVYDTLASIGPSQTTDTPVRHTVPNHVHARPATRAHAGTDDFLVCQEDGLTMKMLKRHLLTVHGLTPDEYRAKWGLPSDYPMVAANYAKLRSSLAKESGLGLRPLARFKRRRI
jgi:predicted transcriptional regulator